MQITIAANLQAALGLAQEDHGPECWTMGRLLATAAAQPNMDPILDSEENRRCNLKGLFSWALQ